MSKIEKALRKARGESPLRVVPRSTDDNRQLVPVADASASTSVPARTPSIGSGMVTPEHRASAVREIARMDTPQPRSRGDLEQRNIIHPEMAESGAVKAFREIRTKIIQRSGGRNCTVVVTSLDGRSGTSFVALNLGVAFAFDAGKTALVMDCNLRNPSLHRLLQHKENRGLTDYLEDPSMDISPIIHSVGIPRLRIIAAGSEREVPAEYFTSLRMHQLMQSIKQRYLERFVVLDAPPMSQSADVQILLELCDYAILVVPYGRVTESQIATSAKAIGEQKLIGVVFNDEPRPPRIDWERIVQGSYLFRTGAAVWEAVKNKKWRRKE